MSVDVPALRRELTTDRLVVGLGLLEGARRQAGGWLVPCPVHREHTPSLSLTTGPDGTARWRCFGCGATGDALTLIAAVRGLDLRSDFGAVLQAAAELAGVQVPEDLQTERRQAPRLDDDEYHRVASALLEACPVVADVAGYLDRRGLLDSARRHGCGELPRTGRQGALVRQLARRFGAETLARAGLVRRDDDGRPLLDWLSWPSWRWLIPWRGPDGRIGAIQRRFIGRRCTHSKYVFPSGRGPRWPFGVESVTEADGDRVAVVEGAADVMALAELWPALPVIGLPGATTWREEWAPLFDGKNVAIATDADEAGDTAAETLAAVLYAAGAVRLTRLRPRGAKDWAALLQARRRPAA